MRESARFALSVALVIGAAQLLSCERRSPLPRRADASARPNVLLVTFDTTRADRLGVYGYARDTSPNLDRMAEESTVYTRAMATSSWTLPSHASIFTGKIPTSHGARFDPEGPLVLSNAIEGDVRLQEYRASPVASTEVTLAERLQEAGYTTGAAVGGPWMKRVFGLGVGFEQYFEEGINTLTGAVATDLTDFALRFVETCERPFFLFINYYDPHGPYIPPARHRLAIDPTLLWAGKDSPLSVLSSAYDAEIHYTDAQLGRLLDALRDWKVYDDTLIIVTADHGELFGEHGRTSHGYYLTEPELHVPLIVKYPGDDQSPRRDTTRVSITAIFASVLERVGLAVPAHADAPLERAAARPVVAETYPHPRFAPDGHWRALYRGNFKFVWNSKGNHELFDLEGDPGEERNLLFEEPTLARSLEEELARLIAAAPRPNRDAREEQRIDDDTREALENLGYVESLD